MQQSKFTAEQMTAILAEASAFRGATKEVARKYGISDKTIGNWKQKFGGMKSDEVRRLKQLEDENSRLKRIVANLTLDNECLRDINSKKW
jgi:putative transposase